MSTTKQENFVEVSPFTELRGELCWGRDEKKLSVGNFFPFCFINYSFFSLFAPAIIHNIIITR
jgi:hypothetical protein